MKSLEIHQIGLATATLWQGDAADGLLSLPSGSVDLIVTSPPYFIGKEYDTSLEATDFAREIRRVLRPMIKALKPGGSICWQVGNHVANGKVQPLDFIVGAEAARLKSLVLRNRIIWTFGHGTHASRRFSGRHETILWYTKGDQYFFNVDPLRVPQAYPGKRHYKGPNKGDWSGHPLGKNPGDVWDVGELWKIPNVNANHIEKTEHPCQFPTALVRRLVAALCPTGGLVADPYLGSGSTAVGALIEGRCFAGGDISEKYLAIARGRLKSMACGELRVREDVPITQPDIRQSVAILPAHFRALREAANG